ncbi:MAG: hypothetical protein LBE59_00040, partial [Nevskiaceae bacterium]|nr:hypothetical protein [Nevskiaceae bacterium]
MKNPTNSPRSSASFARCDSGPPEHRIALRPHPAARVACAVFAALLMLAVALQFWEGRAAMAL